MFNAITRKPFAFFAADDAGGGDPGDDGKKPDTEGNGGDDAKKKQDELDREYSARAKRASEATKKKLYEELGVKDDAEYETYLKTKKEAEDKQKTETQRLADDAIKAKANADRIEAESKTKLAEMQKRIVDSEIKMQASVAIKDKDGKVVRPAFRTDALQTVLLVIQRSKIEEKEDGAVTGIDKALETLAKEHPYLLADGQTVDKAKGSPLKGNNGGKGSKSSDDEDVPMFKSL